MFFYFAVLNGTIASGISYIIARDRKPERAALSWLLGFLFGPLGIAITFLITRPPQQSAKERYLSEAAASETTGRNPHRSAEEIQADIDRMKKGR